MVLCVIPRDKQDHFINISSDSAAVSVCAGNLSLAVDYRHLAGTLQAAGLCKGSGHAILYNANGKVMVDA